MKYRRSKNATATISSRSLVVLPFVPDLTAMHYTLMKMTAKKYKALQFLKQIRLEAAGKGRATEVPNNKFISIGTKKTHEFSRWMIMQEFAQYFAL